MSDLSSVGKALVEAGRQADRPSDADRERVLAALRARLGDAVVLGTALEHSPPPAGPSASRWSFAKWGWVAPAALVGGALLFVPRLWHSGEGAAPAPRASASVSPSALIGSSPVPATAETVSIVAEPLPGPSVPGAGTVASRPPEGQKATARSRDGLADEVALLSRAETELHAGRPANALLALGEHQRRFPRGTLAEERTAARIQALCALGRTDEANAQLRQLLHISPNSAHEARARQACRDPRAP
jgi:hypothetical protein